VIKADTIAPDALKISLPERLSADDFRQIAPLVDGIIGRFGQIRLLIDGSRLHGWRNVEALETHASFVRGHQAKVKRIAVIAPHEWQHWLIAVARVFVHPEVKAFAAGQEIEARQWLVQ
jgi:hypothetical protein